MEKRTFLCFALGKSIQAPLLVKGNGENNHLKAGFILQKKAASK